MSDLSPEYPGGPDDERAANKREHERQRSSNRVSITCKKRSLQVVPDSQNCASCKQKFITDGYSGWATGKNAGNAGNQERQM